MNVWRSRFVSYGLAGGLALGTACGGCAKRRSTMGAAPEVNPPPKVEAKAEARADELGERSRKFDQTVQQLPGRTPEEHRRAMQEVFAELAQILPILHGPNPTGAFRQQLRVVESARTQLASGPQGLAIEPTVDTALRAARDALAGLASRGYFDQAQLGQTMDSLNASIDALDRNRGAMHQTAAAESVGLMSQAIRQMSEAMNQRLDEGAGTETTKAPAAQEPPTEEPAAKSSGEADTAAPEAAEPDTETPDTEKPEATEPEPARPEASDQPPAAEPQEGQADQRDEQPGQPDKPDQN